MPNRCGEIKQEKQPQVAESYAKLTQKVFANFAGKMGSFSRHICMPFLLPHSHILYLTCTQTHTHRHRHRFPAQARGLIAPEKEKLNQRGLRFQEYTGQTTKHNNIICTCCKTTNLMQKRSKNIRHRGSEPAHVLLMK